MASLLRPAGTVVVEELPSEWIRAASF